jgi:hypothetical protein
MPVFTRTVTEKRQAANRAAAARSTGPRTEEGKRRSSFNSFKHGLYATQDGIIRQAFTRAGLDPVQYDQLHQSLAASLQPQDAVQALLVEDLTRLYWLKNLSQRALAEWQARQGELFQFQCQKRQFEGQRYEPVVDDLKREVEGCMGVKPCPEKFEDLYRLLGYLDDLARHAQWDKPKGPDTLGAEFKNQLTEEETWLWPPGSNGHLVDLLLRDIYRGKFTWIGKQIQALFADCAEDRASADDPRVSELRELIRLERAQVADEDRLYQTGRVRANTDPLSLSNPVLLPASKFWQDMTNQEAAFDRQIASKLNLLMKLRREAAAAALDEENVIEDVAGTAARGPEPATAGAADGANRKNTGTNPKSGLTASESASDSQPDDADRAPGQGEAFPPPPVSSSDDGPATASNEPDEPASALDAGQLATAGPANGANTKTAGTNPKNTVTASESASASQPDDADRAPGQGEATPPPPAGDSGGGMH